MVVAVVVELTTGVAQNGVNKIWDHFFPPPPGLAVTSKVVDPADDCSGGGGYVFRRPLSELGDFTGKATTEQQVHKSGGAAAEYLIIELTLQRRRPVTVSVDDVRVNIKQKEPPFSRGTHLTFACQGGGVEVRTFAFDLDTSATAYTVVGRPPRIGGEERVERLPVEPEPGKSLKLFVIPYGLEYGYRFTLTVGWQENGESRTEEIDNGGEPFVVMPARNAAQYVSFGFFGGRPPEVDQGTYHRPWFLVDTGVK
ncbi:hypothetical protein [Streptomyces sp. NPDC088794]|uniref:hypothetical protein n=1 Tax=Streptomyces sp. NPDC088794 TaxID=3365902 RepID=UPI0038119194